MNSAVKSGKHLPKLGVNIDHVATLRQARRGRFPEPCRAAAEAVLGGADQITFHLREDRRHIQDSDLPAIRRAVRVPLNLEMALDPAIVKIALRFKPEKVCLVPEKRQELTTEGGLDVVRQRARIAAVIRKMHRKGIRVSLFIEASPRQVLASAAALADAVEIHTGKYAGSSGRARIRELGKIRKAASLARSLGLAVHAGHGLDYTNVGPVSRIPGMEELNIGYSLIAECVFCGLKNAVQKMREAMCRAA